MRNIIIGLLLGILIGLGLFLKNDVLNHINYVNTESSKLIEANKQKEEQYKQTKFTLLENLTKEINKTFSTLEKDNANDQAKISVIIDDYYNVFDSMYKYILENQKWMLKDTSYATKIDKLRTSLTYTTITFPNGQKIEFEGVPSSLDCNKYSIFTCNKETNTFVIPETAQVLVKKANNSILDYQTIANLLEKGVSIRDFITNN